MRPLALSLLGIACAALMFLFPGADFFAAAQSLYPSFLVSSPASGTAPFDVTFQVRNGSNADTIIFGDGTQTIVNGVGATINHQYQNAGTYTATLENYAGTPYAIPSVTISASSSTEPNPPPTCSMSISPSTYNEFAIPSKIYFTISSQNATAASLLGGAINIPNWATNGSGPTGQVPKTTTTYIATMTGPGGTGTCEATVTVTPFVNVASYLLDPTVSGTNSVGNYSDAPAATIDPDYKNNPDQLAGEIGHSESWYDTTGASTDFLNLFAPVSAVGYLPAAPKTELPCSSVVQGRTAVIVIFGQSYAGNQPPFPAIDGDSTTLAARYTPHNANVYQLSDIDGNCYKAQDPLLGTSGEGGTMWTRLADDLIDQGRFDSVLLVPLAIGGTSVWDWMPWLDEPAITNWYSTWMGWDPGLTNGSVTAPMTISGRDFPDLAFAMNMLYDLNIPPTAIIWEQGGADAYDGYIPNPGVAGTTTAVTDIPMDADHYREYFLEIVNWFRAHGTTAPIYINQEGGTGGSALSGAALGIHDIQAEMGSGAYVGLKAGLNIDAMTNPAYYAYSEHMTAAGLDVAASEWASLLDNENTQTVPRPWGTPSCSLTAELSQPGDIAEVGQLWFTITSVGAQSATIEGGDLDPAANNVVQVPPNASGPTGAVPTTTTTYTATVTGPGGTATCQAAFEVASTSGGGTDTVSKPAATSTLSSTASATSALPDNIPALDELIEQLAADIESLFAQKSSTSAAGSAAAVACAPLSRALSLGMSGPDVLSLQQFLATQFSSFTADLTTGYFGGATQDAVAQWQAQHGIVSTGSPETTGWGVVGPKTRSAMQLCE